MPYQNIIVDSVHIFLVPFQIRKPLSPKSAYLRGVEGKVNNWDPLTSGIRRGTGVRDFDEAIFDPGVCMPRSGSQTDVYLQFPLRF